MEYTVAIEFWNGACYATEDCQRQEANTLEEIKEGIDNMTWDDSEDYDIRVQVTDEDGEVVYTKKFFNNVAKNAQEDMDETWDDPGQYKTAHLGVKDGQWYIWDSNGGKRGSHASWDGYGRWIEKYEQPKKISVKEAFDWLTDQDNNSLDDREAVEKLTKWISDYDYAGDILDELGECIWKEDRQTGLYKIEGKLYSAHCSQVNQVDEDEALNFVAEHDEDSVESVEKLLANGK